jgi:hypothetical protein
MILVKLFSGRFVFYGRGKITAASAGWKGGVLTPHPSPLPIHPMNAEREK